MSINVFQAIHGQIGCFRKHFSARRPNRKSIGLMMFATLITAMRGQELRASVVDSIWTGAAGTANYSNPDNWNPMLTPVDNPTDSFNVRIPANTTVIYDIPGINQINDLILDSGTRIQATSGGSLTVSETAMMDGAFISVYNGSVMSIPSMNHSSMVLNNVIDLFSSDGMNSAIHFPYMTNLSVGGGEKSITAKNHGVINLSAVTNLDVSFHSTASMHFEVTNKGMINFDKLDTISNVVGFTRFTITDATMDLPELEYAQQTSFFARSSGIIHLPKLKSYGSTSAAPSAILLDAFGPKSAIHLSALTNLSVNGGDQIISARNEGVINLPTLTDITVSSASNAGLQFEILDDGMINLDKLQNIDNQNGFTRFTVTGATMDLPELKYAKQTSFFARSSGIIHLPELTSYGTTSAHGGILLDAFGPESAIHLPKLTRLSIGGNGHTISAREEGVIDLSALTSIKVNSSSGEALRFIIEEGAVINLDNLATIYSKAGFTYFEATGQERSLCSLKYAKNTSIAARAFGVFKLPALDFYATTSLAHGTSLLEADGPDTAIHLPKLTNLHIEGVGHTITAREQGFINLAALVSINVNSPQAEALRFKVEEGGIIDLSNLAIIISNAGFTQFEVDGQEMTFDSLNYAWQAGFNAAFGGVIHLPLLDSYGTTNLSSGGMLLSASHPGSSICMPMLTSLSVNAIGNGNIHTIQATDRGLINLSSLTTLSGPSGPSEALDIHVSTGGVIDLDSLEIINSNGGFTRFYITGDQMTFPSLLSATNTRFSAFAGGIVNLPALTTFSANNASTGNHFLYVRHPGSQVHLPALTTLIANSNISNSDLYIEAEDGGLINLSSLTTIDGPSSASQVLSIMASTGGVIDLSRLTRIMTVGRVELHALNSGVIHVAGIDLPANTDVRIIDSGSTLSASHSMHFNVDARLLVSSGGAFEIRGSLSYDNTDESTYVISDGLLKIHGAGVHRLEVGGQDIGIGGSAVNNFGLGNLTIGDEGPSVVMLLDVINNGNRSNMSEALYLKGRPEMDGLSLRNGSTLILNGINVYADIDGVSVHLNSLFADGQNIVSFGDGFIKAVPDLVLPGDFDQSGSIDSTDIDLLLQAVHNSSLQLYFDLTGDSVVNSSDADELIQGFLQTEYGDINLDGRVSIGDLVVLANSFGNVSTLETSWANGDLNGDQKISIGDLTILAQYFGFDSAASLSTSVSIVPLPSSWLAGGALIGLTCFKRRRR